MKMTNKNLQTSRLLNHLIKNKTITPLESWAELGIYRLSAVIFKLKAQGHDIKTLEHIDKNRFGEPVKFAKYVYKIKE